MLIALLCRMSRDRVILHHAPMPLGDEEFLAIFEYRGKYRTQTQSFSLILSHRRMSYMCRTSHSHPKPHRGRMSSLRRGPRIRASHRQRSLIEAMQQISSEIDSYVWVERSFQVFRSPMYAVYMGDKGEPPLQIVEEPTMGPTAFVRLLTMLATRDLLEKIHKWTKLSAGTSGTTTLAQVKQMAGYERIRTLALRRTTGPKRINCDNEMNVAAFAYSKLSKRSRASSGFGCV